MPVNIYIQDKDVDDLIQFYNGKLKSVKERKVQLDKEESAIKATIAQLKSKKGASVITQFETFIPTTDIINDEKEYNKKWIWAKKIVFALKDISQYATSNEIVDRIIVYEPDLDRKRAIASVSSTLSVKSDDDGSDETKLFIKIDDGTGTFKFFVKKGKIIDGSTITAKDYIDISKDFAEIITNETETKPTKEDDDLPF
jgi:hypothetical protein